MLFTAGDRVADRYQLCRRLSRNGIRETWLVRDERSGVDWVLKFLYFGDATDWQALKLMEREAQTLQTLQHSNIPRYSDAFWLERPEEYYFCLLQQYIAGATLAEQLREGVRYSEKELERLTSAMLDILEYLHTQSPPVVHRDIKPSNIICGVDGKFYLIDFGSVQAQAAGRGTMTIVGTFGYMPPEQFAAQSVAASDLYALGATLLHLSTGVDPAEMARKGMRIQCAPELQLEIGWQRWLERLLEPDLEKRLGSASAARIEFIRRSELPATQCTATDSYGSMAQKSTNPSLLQLLLTGLSYSTVVFVNLVLSWMVGMVAFALHPALGFIVFIVTCSGLTGITWNKLKTLDWRNEWLWFSEEAARLSITRGSGTEDATKDDTVF